MGKAKNWEHPRAWNLDRGAKGNTYVIESRQRGGRQNEAVPFSSREAAEAFAKEQGGRLVRFEEMPKSYISCLGEPPGPSASNDGLNRNSLRARMTHGGEPHITK